MTWVAPGLCLQRHQVHFAALAEVEADDQRPDRVSVSQQPQGIPRRAADQTCLPTENTGDVQTPRWEAVRSQGSESAQLKRK